MGGKAKQNQRTKNNAKPSNSGRSAELLSTSVPSFVGFSAHSDLGMIPFAPGFSTTDKLPETFDSSIGAQFQFVLRKMSKKDPVTKVKALQELNDLLTDSEVDVIKALLPLWPKFYQNLANDADHRVRESAQNVQSLIMQKCKKAVAPYLKQLTPVWLSSQFDNYPPAASVASASFQTVFAANKMQEVCVFCQQEIMDYAVRNLTFHTASTLSSTKSCSPEEAENKYQRVVMCSLKMLAFFLEKTAGSDISSSNEKIHNLLSHSKFWSLAKHRTAHVKAAWFEVFYNILQYAPHLTEDIKGQLVPICFQNIDESDPLIVPHVWGCILFLQNVYDDWYKIINFKKQVQSRLSAFLRNACNGNAEAVGPSLLPFLSRLTAESLHDIPLDEFHTLFFNDLKEAIMSSKVTAKSDYAAITAAYFECIRLILQRLSIDASSTERAQLILDEFIIHIVKWAYDRGVLPGKYIFIHTSALIAYWADHPEYPLYTALLNRFWTVIIEDVSQKPLNKQYLDSIVEFCNCLFYANPNLQNHKVKFYTAYDEDTTDGRCRQSMKIAPYAQTDLRKLVVLLVQKCLTSVSGQKVLLYEAQMRTLIKLYGDKEFFADISGKNDMEVTLNLLAGLLCDSPAEVEPSDVIVEIVFEILNFMEKDRKFNFIHKLLETKKPMLQQCLLQRLLSYPMCVEPEVREMLSQDNISEIILQTANELLHDGSREKFNLLHKCFFQTDSGEILINQKTVDGILEIVARPLVEPENYKSMMDPCGSFIAQIMPVVCSDNSSKEAQKDIFLKLFRFTINQQKSDCLSEDTLWEITTCWQDALSSEDIVMDEFLLQKCAEIISQRISEKIGPAQIDNVADVMSMLILCSTENMDYETKRHEWIDKYIEILFKPENEKFDESYERLANFCTFVEAVQGSLTVTSLPDDAGMNFEMDQFLRRSLLNLTAGMKMVCGRKVNRILSNLDRPTDDEECTEDYCDPNENLLSKWTDKMYSLTVELIKIASISESLAGYWSNVTGKQVAIMLEMSEKAKLLLRGADVEHVLKIKECILRDAAFNDVAATRATQYIAVITQYALFQENALILLLEDLTEYFITREALSTYVNLLQFILDDLTAKAITADNHIIRRTSNTWQKCVVFRCLIYNNFNQDTNDISDKQIIVQVINFITEISENQKQHKTDEKELLLYNTDVTKQDFLVVIKTVEYINLLTEVLIRFPRELTIKNWDAIRIGLSSWVLSISKSIENYKNTKASIFIIAVYRLHAALANFVEAEKTSSSSQFLTTVIDEWENLFSTEVNLVLFRSFYTFVQLDFMDYSSCFTIIIENISCSIRSLDYSAIYHSCKAGKKITLDDLINFLLKNISSPVHTLRTICVDALIQLSLSFIATDKEYLEKNVDIVDTKAKENGSSSNWHFMNRFKDHLEQYESAIVHHLDEFSYKLTELADLKPVDRSNALSYLFVWDCIMSVCGTAPVELRSVYTSWLTEHKFDQKFLNFLFRCMPVEILKNHDSKIMSNDVFKGLNGNYTNNAKLPVDKYVCHLYATALSKLPAVVRKWWNGLHSRQKVFVDKLTTNFISGLICQDELETINKINVKEKHTNMQVTVHMSTREVIAAYTIDEARMELIITLAANYPLGGVKVESGKQIGGRASSRNIAMQLTIFLTHQNGSILDGLSLWKKNLDKKFEGVEECYVCYTVIHQDTCQLPRLTCKTCRKKFHSPCLYKWFTTSSKSTCPICRNIF